MVPVQVTVSGRKRRWACSWSRAGRLRLEPAQFLVAQVDDVVAELAVQQLELLAGHVDGRVAAARAGHHGPLLPRRMPVDRSGLRIAAAARAAEGRTVRFTRAVRPSAAHDAGPPLSPDRGSPGPGAGGSGSGGILQDRAAGVSGWSVRVLDMTSGLSQQPDVAARVERLVERAMTFAVEELDDAAAVGRLAWLAHDDEAAVDEACEVCLGSTEATPAIRGRAIGLLARVRNHDLAAQPAHSPGPTSAAQRATSRGGSGPRPAPTSTRRRPPSMRNPAPVSYGEWSAIHAAVRGRADLEGATASMSTEVGDLDAALAGLYGLPLEQFVATRDQLARRLRAAGDRATARKVAALRRPSVSAWAANQLAHAAPNAVAELLDAGAALRQAQQAAVVGQPGAARQLRAATAHLRAAIARLSQRAETLLVRSGHAASDATLARLAATLQAAATGDEATRSALAGGRLPKDLDPAGFGLDLALAPAEPTAPADAEPAGAVVATDRAEMRREQARTAARRALERTRQAAEQAQAILDQAQAEVASRHQAAMVARQRADELSAKAQELAEQAAAAASAAEQARRRADAADRDADEVADRVEAAQQAAEAADVAHTAAAAALEELQ
jgi:hypothetical protein